ncbi:MAG: 5-(carboxyamino)imidazole ribonucleotide mutase [Clostridia bacterium]|nr:5-(carboxyamino)imidazole ribonucleotide mutase [Clostridia bacterium]
MCIETTFGSGAIATAPLIGFVLGSDSDLPHVQPAIEVLKELEVPFEVRVLSAHRTPDDVAEYAKSAKARGLVAIVAAAGGAAALPGALAAHTALPVVGLPVPSLLQGLDSLLSMTQMPPGVPVAAVGVGGGRNAGLFAARIAATADPELALRLTRYQAEQAERVRERDRRVREAVAG